MTKVFFEKSTAKLARSCHPELIAVEDIYLRSVLTK